MLLLLYRFKGIDNFKCRNSNDDDNNSSMHHHHQQQ